DLRRAEDVAPRLQRPVIAGRVRIERGSTDDLGKRAGQLMSADALVVPEALCVDAEPSKRRGEHRDAREGAVKANYPEMALHLSSQRSQSEAVELKRGLKVREQALSPTDTALPRP